MKVARLPQQTGSASGIGRCPVRASQSALSQCHTPMARAASSALRRAGRDPGGCHRGAACEPSGASSAGSRRSPLA